MKISPTSSRTFAETIDTGSMISDFLLKLLKLTEEGIGKIHSTEMKLHFVEPDPTPFYHRSRPLAEALLPLVDKEPQPLENSNVIKHSEV